MNILFQMTTWLILNSLSFSGFAQKPELRFNHLSLKEGLSQSTINAILQDSKGFMWFGTQDGLNQYDGYQFKVYRHDPHALHSLSHNEILALHQDRQGPLWIGTMNGLNRFDYQQEQFIPYFHDPHNPNSLSHDEIWSIYEDKAGLLWIGTSNGLNQFDPQHNQFIRYQPPKTINNLSESAVWPIFEDHKGQLWIGTYGGGLNHFDRQQNQFTHYLPDPQLNSQSNKICCIYEDKKHQLWIGTLQGLYQFDRQQKQFILFLEGIISSIQEDPAGRLWIATDGGGLKWFDSQQNQWIHFSHDSQKPFSLSNNELSSIYQDRAGTWWIGTFGAGLNLFHPYQNKFVHYSHDPKKPNSLNSKKVWAIYEDNAGILWIGTEQGLNRLDRQQETVSHYLIDHHILSIIQDHAGILWIGTLGQGLKAFDPNKKRTIASYIHEPEIAESLIDNTVLSLYEDHHHLLWIGTQAGLDQLERQTNQFIHYSHDPQMANHLNEQEIRTIYEDRKGTLWIGTQSDLNQLDRQNQTFKHYPPNSQSINQLSHPEISSIYEDRMGTLWVSTLGGGLNEFDRLTETFTHYHESEGLANDTVYGILDDNQGSLWLSTNKGLSQFNLTTKQFKNYDTTDGLQSLEFTMGAYFKNQRGELFFGGINGFNMFNPEQIKDNPYKPPIVITQFKIFNQPVKFGPHSPLQQSINETKEITLSYQQTFFSFEFAALDFLRPEKNQYAYQLVGLDQDWIHIRTKRTAYYTNVPHGTYTFRVKGSNNDNVWNEEGIAIKITILPPPWKTWWAYTLYVLTTFAILFHYIRTQKSKLKAKQQELEREQAIAAQLREADRLKDEFLANTSHELRTPLNGIIGITESLLDGATGTLNQQTQANLAMIVSSARRLLSLVNDILDFSKLKQKSFDLQIKAIDMRTMTEVVLTLSQPLIGHKPVQLMNTISTELPPISADEDRVQQILYNLVGNAIKFTDKGTITIFAETQLKSQTNENTDYLAITVSDTGIGIPAEKLDRIFEAFEQADGSTARIYGGTGLGLAVTQQLVRLHGGQLSVQSVVGQGSQFTFTLPLSTEQQSISPPSTPRSQFISSVQPESTPLKYNMNQGDFKVLIVDDEPVNRQVLINHLSLQNYALIQATSGAEALAILDTEKPDLILLDIMMPQMSGYEVIQTIREQWQANELPVILLTAKNQISDLVTGLELGANDYLTKPVSKEELLARIKTHIHIQQLRSENLRMNAELDITHRIQKMLLPHQQELEQVSGLEIDGIMLSAEQVGGDYYDVLQHQGRVIFGIGDATGHGLEGCILMIMAQTAIRTLLEQGEKDLTQFLKTLNQIIYKNVQQRIMVDKNLTLSLLEYESTGLVHLTGQHEEVIIFRNNGDLERIDTQNLGFMIGFMEDVSDLVAQTDIRLHSGDIVVLYTDGIIDAENLEKQHYGIERLCQIIKKNMYHTVNDIRQAIIEDLYQHIGQQKLLDDMTLLVLKQK